MTSMKFIRVLGIVAGMSVALTACQGPTTDRETDRPGAEPSPSSTAISQARETGLIAPARPFDGDCANLLTDAEASTILGSPSAAFVPSFDWAPEYIVELNAGAHCQWSPVDGSFSASIKVVLLPAGAVDYDAPANCEPGGEFAQYLGAVCPIEATVNEIRVSGAVWGGGNEVGPATTMRDAFIDIFTPRASAGASPPVPLPAIGAWALPVDCAAVVAAGDFSAVPGLGAVSTGGHAGGTDVPFAPAETALWGGLGMPFCGVTGESVEVIFVASGGGRWMESAVAATGTPFVIDGYESAFVTPGQVGLTKVDIFQGPNWLHFQIRHTGNAKAMADALFAALATTAAE